MTDTITGIDDYGRIKWRHQDDSGYVSREVVLSGHWENGSWVDTDTSAYPQIVQDAAAEHWTTEVVDAYKLAFPWVEPEPPPAFENLSKNLLWERTTDAEAKAMWQLLQSQPIRVRQIYEGATYISNRAELYTLLQHGLVTLFGAERATELLEPNF